MNHAAGRALVAAALSLMACGGAAGLTNAVEVREYLASVSVAQSHSGRFVAAGTNRLWNAALLRWADTASQRLENLIGLPAPSGGRVLRFAVVSDPAAPAGVEVSQSLAGGRLAQQMTVRNYEAVAPEEADFALYRLLLNGYMIDPAPRGATGAAGLPDAPGWLTEGVARSLHGPARAESLQRVVEEWEQGRGRSPADVLAVGDAPGRPPPAARDLCAAIVEWVRSRPDSRERFASLLGRLAQRAPLTASWTHDWLTGPGESLDAAWDRWMLAQRRIVRAPGTVTPYAVAHLRRELVFRLPPEEAAPGQDAPLMPISELVAFLDRSWVPALARERIVRLRLLAAGRGDRFRETVDAYCRYLEGVERRRGRKRLQALLDEADARLKTLQAGVDGR